MLAPITRRALASTFTRASRCTRRIHTSPIPSIPKHLKRTGPPATWTHSRYYSSKSTVDEKIEEIQDQYGTAKDEFEIASEETEKMSVYAEDDRGAAREELDKLKTMFDEAVADPETGEEVKSRIGQRIRELDNAVKNMEEMALNQD